MMENKHILFIFLVIISSLFPRAMAEANTSYPIILYGIGVFGNPAEIYSIDVNGATCALV
jgi:hypothetical protein